jgi:hypothetical protein
MIFSHRKFRDLVLLFALVFACAPILAAQLAAKSAYDQINAFSLGGGKVDVTNLVLKRDRVVMTFTGTFYFATPVGGATTGAVFVGQGTFAAEAPPVGFEKLNLKRFLKTDAVKSNFTTAVIRFSDDTFDIIGKGRTDGPAPVETQRLASEFEGRVRKETGANVAARITQSLVNQEPAGIFFATFSGGERDRFSFVFDPEGRIPSSFFAINGGEKGLIFTYQNSSSENDVWMAFFGVDDYAKNRATYSDVYDLVDVTNYAMQADLREPKSNLKLRARITMVGRFDNVRAIPFNIGENLGESDNMRLKKQLGVQSASIGGKSVEVSQEDWESGFTIFPSEPIAKGQQIKLDIDLQGDILRQAASVENCSYPLSNDTWFPRHGYLDRATFDLTFIHSKKLKVASTGTRISEAPYPEDKDAMITTYKMSQPIPLATFALGPWERHSDTIKWESGAKNTPLEFNSLSGAQIAAKEDFILAELNNSVRFFTMLFGPYPYESYAATFHPYGFGQGFPTMLMIPAADNASKYTYSFISHETAHQWWGGIVAWRSYRDQWLSEGFAEYSGVLYTQRRQNWKAGLDLIEDERRSLKQPPQTEAGPGKGRLVDVGPIILGHRLETRKSYGSYSTLIYNKGSLVLRMLHFLFTDPGTGNGQPFFDMMKDFVNQYKDNSASTDDFRRVANEHFVNTPIAKKYGLTDLNWFFEEWVYETALPTYTLEYSIDDQTDGTAIISGNVIQENAPENWIMPLPVVMNFGGNRNAVGTVVANGPKQSFKIKVPAHPAKVELDPDHWVLSDKTVTK